MIREIYEWDWPDTVRSRYGYDDERTPELTVENLQFLANKINELIAQQDLDEDS